MQIFQSLRPLDPAIESRKDEVGSKASIDGVPLLLLDRAPEGALGVFAAGRIGKNLGFAIGINSSGGTQAERKRQQDPDSPSTHPGILNQSNGFSIVEPEWPKPWRQSHPFPLTLHGQEFNNASIRSTMFFAAPGRELGSA
jgi:hypothetical protein